MTLTRTEALAALREFLAERPYGSQSFKDQLATYEALSRVAFGQNNGDENDGRR